MRKRHYLLLGMLLSLFGAVFFVLFCAVQILRYSQTGKSLPDDVEAAVILGAAAWGERPSPVFRERINHAIALYQKGQVKRLIFTGSTPKADFMTEAEVGRRFALKQGVDGRDILFENTSQNTYQNLLNAKAIMQMNNIEKVVIVSDPYHMARAAAMAHDLNIDAVYSPTPTSRYNDSAVDTRLRFFVQETQALAAYYVTRLF